MKRLAVVLTVLGFSAPAFADDLATAQAAVLTDSELDQVAAGCETGASSPTTNVNISPIVVNQTAVALTTQTQKVGKAGKKAKVKQNANTVAMNYAHINYHVKF